MVSRRELSRREAQRNRAVARLNATLRVNVSSELAASALLKASRVIADKGFVRLLLVAGVNFVPECLVHRSDGQKEGLASTSSNLARISLEFTLVWKFLYPLFSNPQVKAYLDTMWPGFILELKDAFIALVIDGMFADAMSGHRGRPPYDLSREIAD